MKVRALKEGAIDGRLVAPGTEFELDQAPTEWFDPKDGWLELVDPGERLRRRARTLFVNDEHPLHSRPRTLREVQDQIDDEPPPEAA